MAEVEPLIPLGKALLHYCSLLTRVIIRIHSCGPVGDIVNACDCGRTSQVFNFWPLLGLFFGCLLGLFNDLNLVLRCFLRRYWGIISFFYFHCRFSRFNIAFYRLDGIVRLRVIFLCHYTHVEVLGDLSCFVLDCSERANRNLALAVDTLNRRHETRNAFDLSASFILVAHLSEVADSEHSISACNLL